MKKHYLATATLSLGLVLALTACDKAAKPAADAAKPAATADAAKPAATTEKTGLPAVVYSEGGKFDKSFNQSAYNGAEAFKKESGKDYAEFEMQAGGDMEGVLRRFASKQANPIVTLGMGSGNALTKISAEIPKSNFAIIDFEVKAPNVKSVLFREQEGSFLVGAVAALKSTSGKIGFVGGMDIPVIRRFQCGFEQGAKHINPKIGFISKTVSSNGADAWNNPTRGGELAKASFDEGVDVIFAAAGATGNGVYQAAKDNKKFAIGVDQNQNHLHPGTMLTSMVKRVDTAVTTVFKEASAGSFKAGTVSLGLAEDGVDWALDEHNRSLITADMEAKVNQIKKDIIAGKIKVNCQ